jgi:hypothetical protein
MSHFNLKTLSFYGVAIGSVLVLFKVVSTYGEKNLIAASEIGGLYQIVENQNLPDCLADQKLNLTIEQSGVYLFGNLADQAVAADDKSRPTFPLSGNFKNEEIVMAGQGQLASCDPGLQLTIQGRRDQNSLVGTIQETSGAAAGSFIAQYQEVKEESANKGH